jgi:hypothetical protein
VFCFRRIRRGDHNVVGLRQRFVQFSGRPNLFYVRWVAFAGARDAPCAHAECLRALRELASDRAVTDDEQHAAVNFGEVLRPVPQILLRPFRGILKAHGVGKVAHESENHSHGVLRHRYRENPAGIGDDHAGTAQLRVH